MLKNAEIKIVKKIRTVSLLLSGALYTADMLMYPADVMANSYQYAKTVNVPARITILISLAVSLAIFIVMQTKILREEYYQDNT